MESLKIVFGLGNPGLRYRSTRHNLGFRVVEWLAENRGSRLRDERELKSRVLDADLPTECGRLILAQPRTFMNRSGRAAAALCRRYDARPEQFLVVYDDADLALGRIRIRPGGGAGGHNGIRSIMDAIGTGEFPRIRLGVRGEERGAQDLADYVLAPFLDEERVTADELVEFGGQAVESWLREGLAAAMNRYNATRATVPTPPPPTTGADSQDSK